MIWLDDELHLFPSPLQAPLEQDIIAIGGDLNPRRLLLGYSLGLFPWYNEGHTPILWQSPNPRFVLFPELLTVNRSLRRAINRSDLLLTIDQTFSEVLSRCAAVERPDQDGTWLNPNLISALTSLHNLGYAHSAEAWRDGKLVGGLYGVAMGGVFYGESMFTEEPDASKVTFVALVKAITKAGFRLIDCQAHTPHLERFGAINISRPHFHALLREYIRIQPHFPSTADLR